jgi:hypothetical protein
LTGKVKPGRTVAVADDSGRTIKGKLVDLSSSSLTVLAGSDRQTFRQDQVRQLAEMHRETGKWALRGLGIGAAAGALTVLVACQNCEGNTLAFALAGVIAYGGIGAGVGAAIGASRTHERVIYRAPVPHAATAFAVTPFVSKQGTGVTVALRF